MSVNDRARDRENIRRTAAALTANMDREPYNVNLSRKCAAQQLGLVALAICNLAETLDARVIG